MKWGSAVFRTIQAKLIIIYVLLILIAMQLIGVYFVSSMKNSLTLNFSGSAQYGGAAVSVYGPDVKGRRHGRQSEYD